METVIEIYNELVETDEPVDVEEVKQYVEMMMPVLCKKAPVEFLKGLLNVIDEKQNIVIVKNDEVDDMKKPEEKLMDMKNHEVIDGEEKLMDMKNHDDTKKPEQVVKQGLNKLKYII